MSTTDQQDLSSILDNNPATGIDRAGANINIRLDWLSPINVTNVTFKPKFQGGAPSAGEIRVGYDNLLLIAGLPLQNFTWKINGYIDRLEITFDGTAGHLYFNDIIINYTGVYTDPKIPELQQQVDQLTAELTALNQTTITLSTRVATVEAMVAYLQENVTSLWNAYDMLNASLTDLIANVDALNISNTESNQWLKENVTSIRTDITAIQNDIIVLQKNDTLIPGLLKNDSLIPGIQSQIAKTSQNITRLQQNITAIKASIPAAYNDTVLKGRITSLESQVKALQTENTDLKTGQAAVPTMQNDVKNLKDDQSSQSMMVNLAIVLAIVGLLLGIVGIAAAISRKKEGPNEGGEPPVDEDE
jgi:prefoldin subunit 5